MQLKIIQHIEHNVDDSLEQPVSLGENGLFQKLVIVKFINGTTCMTYDRNEIFMRMRHPKNVCLKKGIMTDTQAVIN